WIAMRVACDQVTAARRARFMGEMRRDIPDGGREDLPIAFRQSLTNAMEHGGGFDPDKVIDVTAVRTERAIVCHFRDPGAGFQRETLAQAAVSRADDPLAHM